MQPQSPISVLAELQANHEEMSYMKLKRAMLRAGAPKPRVDACAGKAELLYLLTSLTTFVV